MSRAGQFRVELLEGNPTNRDNNRDGSITSGLTGGIGRYKYTYNHSTNSSLV
jgi:hypothetical protein